MHGRIFGFLRWDKDRGNATIISHHPKKTCWGEPSMNDTEKEVWENKGWGTTTFLGGHGHAATFLGVRDPVETYLAIFRSGCYARHPLLDPWTPGGRGPPSLPLTSGYSHTGIQTTHMLFHVCLLNVGKVCITLKGWVHVNEMGWKWFLCIDIR